MKIGIGLPNPVPGTSGVRLLEGAERVVDSALRSETALTDAVRAVEEIGITGLFLDPTTAALHQVDRLADVVL